MALMSKKELSKLKNHMAEYAKLKKENAELKAMLKLVAKDISSLAGNSCRTSCEKCLFYNDGKDECVYKYMDKIKNLIGGEDNAVTDKN